MAKKYIDPEILKSRFMNGCDDYLPLWKIEMVIDDAPAADVKEVKHGEWLDGNRFQPCSECRTRGKKSWSYCPACGVRMDGKEKTE